MAYTGKFGEACVQHHTAKIFDRGGSNPRAELVDLAKVEWNRLESAKTSATITISGRACSKQAGTLTAIEPRRHELVLFRGKERVWEGPVMNTSSTSTDFTLIANDVIEYLDGTSLSADWSLEASMPMVQRIADIITYELTTDYVMQTNQGPVTVTRWENIDIPANILQFMEFHLGPTLTTAVTTPFQMTLGAYLANRGASIGVNYTTIGRKLVVWDGVLSQVSRDVTENDFSGDFKITKDGSSLNTVKHVASTTVTEGEDPDVGHANNDMSYYGPWESIGSTTDTSSDTDSGSNSTLNSQARAALTQDGYPVPITLQTPSGATFIPGSGIGINDLVAGTQIPVRAANNIRKLNQMQRLHDMKVTEDASGETISVNLEAVGQIMVDA